MFGMLSVLAEFQRELIVANTRDGLAAARARGRLGGRRPKLSIQQVEQAQRLYDEGRHTVQQIADILGVKRGTLYGHLDKTSVGNRPHAHQRTSANPVPSTSSLVPARATVVEVTAADGESSAPAMRISVCPSCGHTPLAAHARLQLRLDLTVCWLEPDPALPGKVVERRHCVECQPRELVAAVDCGLCESGPIVVGTLATHLIGLGQPSQPVRRWLLDHDWSQHPTYGMLCPDHAAG